MAPFVNTPQWLFRYEIEVLVSASELIAGDPEPLVLDPQANVDGGPIENRHLSGEQEVRQIMTLVPGVTSTHRDVHGGAKLVGDTHIGSDKGS